MATSTSPEDVASNRSRAILALRTLADLMEEAPTVSVTQFNHSMWSSIGQGTIYIELEFPAQSAPKGGD